MKLIKIITISKLQFFNELKSQYSNGLELLNDAKYNSTNIIINYNNKNSTIIDLLNKLCDSDYLENILHILCSKFIENINLKLNIENYTPKDMSISIQINILIKQLIYKYTIDIYSIHIIIDLSNYSNYLIKLYLI